MARWEPNASGRLAEAAMELFSERGYGKTTVEDIAARAGLTERTFFRYFTDKREVLFAGSDDFVKGIVDGVRAAPKASAPLEAVLAGFESTGDFFDARRPFSRRRSAVIAAHPELQERELIKLLSLATAIAECLEKRGVARAPASLAAEAGLAIFKMAFEQWVRDPRDRGLAIHLRAAQRQLEAVVGGSKKRAATR
jgi:AcrR family transcriptional regulator